jgi:hypothetical protein
MNKSKFIHPVSFLLAALIGITAGACKTGEMRIERLCKQHCKHVDECNQLVEYDDCISDCIETSDECDSDQDVEMALEKLKLCPDKACGEVLGCATEAWVECKF